jgi:hypothetical protein
MFVARLKPLDPRKGHVAESYAHAGLGLRWNQGTAHHSLSEEQAAVLRKADLFDVVAEEDWQAFAGEGAPTKAGLRAPPPAGQTATVGVLIETLDHTDAGGVRVQHTQPAPPPAPQAGPARTVPARPKRTGGGK